MVLREKVYGAKTPKPAFFQGHICPKSRKEIKKGNQGDISSLSIRATPNFEVFNIFPF